MSLKPNCNFVVLGGMPFETAGRALGPYRIRTAAEQAGFTTSIIDFAWGMDPTDIDTLLDYAIGKNTVAIGVSYTWEPIRPRSGQINFLVVVKQYLARRQLQIPVVLGCANLSRIDPVIAGSVDWIVGGFAELSLPCLLQDIRQGTQQVKYHSVQIGSRTVKIINSNVDYVLDNMNQLQTEFQSDDLFQAHQPLTIETCRGCVFSCAYCSYQFTGKKDYQYIRPVDNLVQELRRNYDLFGTTRYAIADDTFNDSLEKIDRLRRAVDQAGLPKFEFACYLRAELLVTRPQMIPALVDLGIRAAHLGIESLNDSSRRAVGRSSQIEKIADAVCALKQQSPARVGTLGSFIVGLPYDSKQDLEQQNQYLLSDANNWLDSWTFGPLVLHSRSVQENNQFKHIPGQDRGSSAIERFPQQFGYKLTNSSHSIFADWHNTHMNFAEAQALAVKFNQAGSSKMSFGGWFVAAGWYFNLDEQQMASAGSLMTLGSPDILFAKGRESCERRAKYWISHIQRKS